MEQADYFKMTMSVAEAKKIAEKLPETCERFDFPQSFMTKMIYCGLNLTQAQALLVLTWNKVLDSAQFCYEQFPSKDT